MDFQIPKEFDEIDRGLQNLFRLHKSLLSDFHPQVGPRGLNQTHWRALVHIADSGSECMKGVGSYVGLEAGSFTPVADRLIDEGLVERFRDSRDRRRILLRITNTGESVVKNLKHLMKEHFAYKLSVLNKKQLNNLAAAMAIISDINIILQGHNNE